MSDEGWRGLEEGWERLRWARARKFETALAAAESMGMNADTYRAYERAPDTSKHTQLDHTSARRFATKFKVRWEWLLVGDSEGRPWLDGEGPPEDPATPERRVGELLKRVAQKEREELADVLEAMINARRR